MQVVIWEALVIDKAANKFSRDWPSWSALEQNVTSGATECASHAWIRPRSFLSPSTIFPAQRHTPPARVQLQMAKRCEGTRGQGWRGVRESTFPSTHSGNVDNVGGLMPWPQKQPRD